MRVASLLTLPAAITRRRSRNEECCVATWVRDKEWGWAILCIWLVVRECRGEMILDVVVWYAWSVTALSCLWLWINSHTCSDGVLTQVLLWRDKRESCKDLDDLSPLQLSLISETRTAANDRIPIRAHNTGQCLFSECSVSPLGSCPAPRCQTCTAATLRVHHSTANNLGAWVDAYVYS